MCKSDRISHFYIVTKSNKLYFISNFVKAQIFGQIEPNVNTVNTANTANTSNTANAANTTIRWYTYNIHLPAGYYLNHISFTSAWSVPFILFQND